MIKYIPLAAAAKRIKRGGTQHGHHERLQRDRLGAAGQNPAVDGAIRVARGSDWNRPHETDHGLHVGRVGVRHSVRPDGHAGQQLVGVRVSRVRHRRSMVQEDMQRDTSELPPPPVPIEQSGSHATVSPATRWLTYWITFAAVLIVQQLCGDVLQIIPFYFLAKILFFAWCALPMEANGAAFMHRFVVRDYLKRFFN